MADNWWEEEEEGEGSGLSYLKKLRQKSSGYGGVGHYTNSKVNEAKQAKYEEEYQRQYAQYQAERNAEIANSIKMSSPLEMENRAQQERVEAMNAGPNKLTPEMEYRRQMAAQGENALTPYMVAMQATMAKMPTMPETRSNDELEERANALSSAARVTRNTRNEQGLRLLSDPSLMYNQGFTQNLRNLSNTEERTSAAAASARGYADTIMAQRNEAEYQEFMKLMQNPDFAEKSQMDPDTAARGWTEVSPSLSRYSAIYDRQQARDRMAAGGGPEAESRTAFITDDEAAVYSYIWNTQGAKKANAFYDTYLKSRLDERQAGKSAEYLSEYTANNWLAANAASVAMNAVSGAGMVDVGLQYMARRFGITSRDAPVNYNTRAGRISQNVQTIRNTTAEAIEKANPNANKKLLGQSINYASFLYQTGMSMADSSLGMVLNLMGVPEAATLALMGGAAGMSAIQDARRRGASDGQALAFGIASALSEALFEKVSLDLAVDNILGAFGERLGDDSIKTVGQGILKALGKDPNKHNLVSWVLSTLAGAFVEGSEEGFTTLANTLSDRLIMGDKSEIEQRKQALLAQGVSDKEAGRAALKSWTSELLADVIGGMISGGVMGGSTGFIGQVATPAVQSYQIAGAITDYQNQKNAEKAYDRQMEEYNRRNAPALTIPSQETVSARQADPLGFAMNKATSGETVTKQDARAIIENPQALQALRDSGVLTGKVANDSEGRGKVVDAVNALAQRTATQENAQQEERVSTPPVPRAQESASETATEGRLRIPDQNKASVLDAMRIVNPELAEAYTTENAEGPITDAVNVVSNAVKEGEISANAGAWLVNQMFTASQDADMRSAFLQSLYNSSTGTLTQQALNAAQKIDNQNKLRVRGQQNTPPVPKSGLTVRAANDTLNENRQEGINGQAETAAPAETAEQRRAREESASFREQAGKAAGREVLDGSEWRTGMARIIQNVRNLSAARNIQQRASEAARLQHQAETRNLREVSGQDLSVAGATASKTAKLAENDMMGAEWNKMVKDLAAQGITLRGVIGQIESEDIAPDGSRVMIRAFVSGDNKNIVVQVDHPYLSWQQLLAHEELHRRIKESKSYRKEVMDSLLNDEKLKPYLSQIIDKYAEAYHSIRPNMTDEEIIEELLADYRAGFDMLDPLGLRTPESAKMAKRAAGDIRAVEKKGTKGEAAAESEGTGNYSTEIGNYEERDRISEGSRNVSALSETVQKVSNASKGNGRGAADRRRSGETGALGYGGAREYGSYEQSERKQINSFLSKLFANSPSAIREAGGKSPDNMNLTIYEIMQYEAGFIDTLVEENPENREIVADLEEYLEGLGAGRTAEISDIRNSYTPEFVKKYTQLAEDYFGTTEDFDEAGYIDTDGKLLDFKKGTRDAINHREVYNVLDFLHNVVGRNDGMIEFLNMGNIRVTENGLELTKEPNAQQRAAMRDFVEHYPDGFQVDITGEDGKNLANEEYTNPKAAKVISDIDTYFRDGVYPKQSDVARFHSMGGAYSTEIGDTYNRTALLSEETVDRWLKDYASKSSPKYAQAYITRMTPDQFLKLTTSATGRLVISQQTEELDAEKLIEATQQNPLQLRISDGEVVGHEGRHRINALMRAGVNSVPVLVFDSSNKYSKQDTPEMTLRGQDFGSTRSNATVILRDLTPLSYENRDKIVKDYGTQPVTERYQEKYNGRKTVKFSTEIETAINQSMTMEQARKMIQRAFVLGEIKEWFDGEYKNGDEWLQGEGSEAVALIVDNEESLQHLFLDKIPGVINGDFYAEDIIEAYKNGTLTGKEKKTAAKADLTNSKTVTDSRFYAPQQIENAKELYDTASQRMTKSNEKEVIAARAAILLYAHNKGAADTLGLTDAELNKRLRSWSNYSAKAREASQRINAGVTESNRWTGIENSAYVMKASVTQDEVARVVGKIEGDSDGYQNKYIARTVLALDTHIDWSWLNFKFDTPAGVNAHKTANESRCNGYYTSSNRQIHVKRDAPNTVAHEMGHALDDQWGREVGVGGFLSQSSRNSARISDEVRPWFDRFHEFCDTLADSSDIRSSYSGDIKETFARFVDRFVGWTEMLATGYTPQDRGWYNDKFTTAQFVQFARLLQEKAALDANGATRNQVLDKETGSASIEVDPDVAAQFSPEGIDKRQVSELLNENEELKQKLKKAKAQIKTSDRTQPREEDVRRMAKDILKAYDSEASVSGITDSLRELAHTVMSNDTRWTDVHDQAVKIAGRILENSNVLINEDSDWNREIRNDIRSTAISFKNKNDIPDYNEWRKENFGRLRISNNGMPVETRWQELQDTYGKYYFPEEITNPTDQILHLAELWDRLQDVYDNPYSADMAEATQFLANDIIDRVISNEIRQAPTTYADRAEARLARETLRGELRVQKVMERLQAERERRNEKIAELKEHYKSKEAKGRENRKARDMRAKIINHAKNMTTELLKPTDKKHVPESLRKSVAAVLSAIDLGSGYDTTTGQDGKTLRVGRGTEGAEQTKRTKAFLELREALLKEADGLVLDPELLGTVEEPGNLTRLVTELADVPIANMNTEQLQVVYDALRGIEGAVNSANRMLSSARWAAVSEAADAIRGENSAKHAPLQLAGALGRAQDLTRLDMLTPEGYFHRLGKSGQAVFKMLRGAQDQFITNMAKATEDTQKIVGDTDVGALEKEKHTVTMGGEEVTMTTAQIMELYCLMQRDQGLQHITTGGIMIEPVRQGIKQTTQTEPVHPSMEELLDAVRLLTPDEIRMAGAMQDYLSKDMAELGNAATMAVYGYKKFGQESKYWKIRSNKNEIQQSIEKETQTTSVANRGFTKAVNPNANTSVKIGSIFDTYSQSVNDMATYAAWLAVGEDVNRIRNYVFKDSDGQRTGTVKGVLDRVIGSGGANYLQRLLADIANGAGMDDAGLTSGFVGAYKAAAIGANIRVIIQQPTAILRAAEMIDPKYLASGLKNPMKAFERAKEYSPIAQWKDWGYFDINTGRKMKDILFESSSKLEKVRQVSMAMAGKADSFAWGQLWGAVEAETKAKTDLKPGTRDFYEACAERFNDIIDHTQVVDGILQRSQIMRSKNAITRMAVSFMSEPTKQYNQFMSAVYDYRHSGDKKKAKQMLARTTFSMLAAGVMNVLAQSIVDALRNGDREKKYWEKLLQSFLGYNPDDDTFGDKFKTFAFSNMGELINPATYLPYAKDIMSIIQGYSVERMDMDGLSDTITAINRLAKAINGQGNQTVVYTLGKAIEQGAKLLGLSAYNVDRDLTALITTIANDADMPVLQYYLNRYRYRPGENLTKDLKGILWDARQKNDGSYDIIVEHLLKDGYTQEQIDKVVVQKVSDESGFTDARKAADAEGNNNGSYDLSETLEALGNATLSEEDRDVLLEAKLSDKQYGNYTTLLQYSDYDTWLSVMREMPATLSQAKIEAVLDKRDDLTTTQKAAYWQVLSGSKSTKNNPYSQEIGAEILNAKAESQPDAEPEKVTQMRTTLSGLGLQDSKVDALAPVLGGDGSNTSKWRAVANQNLGKDQQDAVLKSIMTDAMYRNWSIASGENISLDSYVKGREAYVDLDNSGTDQNGEWTAALEKVDFDKDASRNNYIKGVLWQIYTGSTSTKNNPFDKAGGQAVLDAKSKGGGKGTGSNAPARIPTLRIPAAPTVTKPTSGLRIRGTQPTTAPRSGLRIRSK